MFGFHFHGNPTGSWLSRGSSEFGSSFLWSILIFFKNKIQVGVDLVVFWLGSIRIKPPLSVHLDVDWWMMWHHRLHSCRWSKSHPWLPHAWILHQVYKRASLQWSSPRFQPCYRGLTRQLYEGHSCGRSKPRKLPALTLQPLLSSRCSQASGCSIGFCGGFVENWQWWQLETPPTEA